MTQIEQTGQDGGAAPDIAAIWRNGITNTVAVLDLVREKHFQNAHARNKAFLAFCDELDAELERWFKLTRHAAPTTYEESEKVWRDYCQGPQPGDPQ